MAPDGVCSSWLLHVPLQHKHLHFYDLSAEKLTQQPPAQEGDSTTGGKFITPASIASPRSSSLNIMASLQPELPARPRLLQRSQLCSADPATYVCSLHPYADIRLLWWNLAMVNSSQIIPFWGLKQNLRASWMRYWRLLSEQCRIPEVTLKLGKHCHRLVKLWSWLAQIRNTSVNLPSFLTESPCDDGR